jgi:hypothetical protein
LANPVSAAFLVPLNSQPRTKVPKISSAPFLNPIGRRKVRSQETTAIERELVPTPKWKSITLCVMA